eukprot:2618545-Pleurochrysis_carterae.AAC.2
MASDSRRDQKGSKANDKAEFGEDRPLNGAMSMRCIRIGATNGACKGAGELVQARRCIVGLEGRGCKRRPDLRQKKTSSKRKQVA